MNEMTSLIQFISMVKWAKSSAAGTVVGGNLTLI